MNAKTAKLIRKYSFAVKRHHRGVKRIYNRLPKSKRHAANNFGWGIVPEDVSGQGPQYLKLITQPILKI